MQNIQDLQDKFFFQSKSILQDLAKINSREELIGKQELFLELMERISFLKILDKNMESFLLKPSQVDFKEENVSAFRAQSYHSENTVDQDPMEEEVLFINEINEISENIIVDKVQIAEMASNQSINPETDLATNENNGSPGNRMTFEIDNELVQREKQVEVITPMERFDERVAQNENDFLGREERPIKVVELMKKETTEENSIENLQQNSAEPLVAEKKFKLSSIKGLKVFKDTFDKDPLENLELVETAESEGGSSLKSNIPTQFMDTAKKKQEFRLDFNDKIAFTKLLFRGDEAQLKETIDKLNSFNNVEDAKEYLSDLYYKNDWSKVDEYAQRLWNLVENKFF